MVSVKPRLESISWVSVPAICYFTSYVRVAGSILYSDAELINVFNV